MWNKPFTIVSQSGQNECHVRMRIYRTTRKNRRYQSPMKSNRFIISFRKITFFAPDKYSRHVKYYMMLLLLRSLIEGALETRIKESQHRFQGLSSSRPLVGRRTLGTRLLESVLVGQRSILSQPWPRCSSPQSWEDTSKNLRKDGSIKRSMQSRNVHDFFTKIVL